MGVLKTQHEDDGHGAPPDVKLTPAAQPPSPQPSITGHKLLRKRIVKTGSCSVSIG